MKVKQLIEKLKDCDQELDVFVNLDTSDGTYDGDVNDLMQFKVTRKDGFTTSWVELMCNE